LIGIIPSDIHLIVNDLSPDPLLEGEGEGLSGRVGEGAFE